VQTGKIFAQFSCKSFISFYFIAKGRAALADKKISHPQLGLLYEGSNN